MKYAIKSLTSNGGGVWTSDVEYWQGCRCGSKIKQVTINQEKRPSRSVIIEEFKRSSQNHQD